MMGWLLHTLGLDHKPRIRIDPQKEEAIRRQEAQIALAIVSHKKAAKGLHEELGKLVLQEVRRET